MGFFRGIRNAYRAYKEIKSLVRDVRNIFRFVARDLRFPWNIRAATAAHYVKGRPWRSQLFPRRGVLAVIQHSPPIVDSFTPFLACPAAPTETPINDWTWSDVPVAEGDWFGSSRHRFSPTSSASPQSPFGSTASPSGSESSTSSSLTATTTSSPGILFTPPGPSSAPDVVITRDDHEKSFFPRPCTKGLRPCTWILSRKTRKR